MRLFEIELPEWLLPYSEKWAGYIEMRKLIRKPMTDRAMRLAFGILDDLRARGFDPGEVLDQSIFMAWQGLYEPKGASNGTSGSRHQKRQRDTLEAARRAVAGDGGKIAGEVRAKLPS